MDKIFKKIISPIDETDILSKVEPLFYKKITELSTEEKRNPEQRKRITINTRGTKYEVLTRRIQNYPETRLAKINNILNNPDKGKDIEALFELCDDFDLKTNEFFFDRNSLVLESVLEFYKSGRLHFPTGFCVQFFDDELKYWGLNECFVNDCCQLKYNSEKENLEDELNAKKKLLAQLYHRESYGNLLPHLREKIWHVLDKPLDSYLGIIYLTIYYAFITISIICIILSTIPNFTTNSSSSSSSSSSGSSNAKSFKIDGSFTTKEPLLYLRASKVASFRIGGGGSGGSSSGKTNNGGNQNPPNPFGGSSSSGSFYGSSPFEHTNTNAKILFYLDMTAMIVFLIEFIFRIVIHPNKLRILVSPLFYIDMIAIIPYFIYLCGSSSTGIQKMIIIASIFRCFLLFKFFRHLEMLRMLTDTLIKSYKEMIIYFIYLGLGVLIFSSFMYYIEQSDDSTTYFSIPAAFWWAIITLTTVGYGDMYPSTIPGKCIAGVCAITGVILIAMPISLLANNFASTYNFKKKKARILKVHKERINLNNNNECDCNLNNININNESAMILFGKTQKISN